MDCILWIVVFIAGILLLVTVLRWVDQLAIAIRKRHWRRVVILCIVPPSAWFFPSTVSAGRAVPVPPHEPVMGFGSPPHETELPSPSGPPGFPVQPPAPPKPAAPGDVDPDKIAKLKQKMREQGLLPPEHDGE